MDTLFLRLLVVEMNSYKIYYCMIDKNWFATIPKKNSSPTRFLVWRLDISVSLWSPSYDVIVIAHCRMVIIVVASPCQTAIARPPLYYLLGRYQEDHIKYHLHSFSKLAWVIHTEQLFLNPMPRHYRGSFIERLSLNWGRSKILCAWYIMTRRKVTMKRILMNCFEPWAKSK